MRTHARDTDEMVSIIDREVRQEIADYIDGDAENGPRFGVVITPEEIEVEVENRRRTDWVADGNGGWVRTENDDDDDDTIRTCEGMRFNG